MRCLLCDHEHLEEADRRSVHEIKMIWEAMGIQFKDGAFPIGDGEVSEYLLWRCGRCGFEFFDPRTAGNSLFYESLESPNYYTPNRPEFGRTVNFAMKHNLKNVLDVGCGAGSFLDMAREVGCETYGLEFNQSAVLKARSKGHWISGELLENLPPDFCPQGFDLITLFQVLEHVADPIGIIQNAVERLAPGGYLSLAVPSKNGIYRFLRADPAQWPPHHISWWSLGDFQTIAGRTRLQLVKSGGDLLLGTDILHAVKSRCLYESISRKKESAYHEGVIQMGALIYRKTGLKFIAPRWGSSIYAFLQKV
jgi:2-polyprenyl-3-methyl-5-hydroxy-6-metoxy-1,4-benzoquinol methylase